MICRPPTSTLFPYTTLFRSTRPTSLGTCFTSPRVVCRNPSVGNPVGIGRRRTSDPMKVALRRPQRSEEHTSELQSRRDLVCRLLLEKKKQKKKMITHTKIPN